MNTNQKQSNGQPTSEVGVSGKVVEDIASDLPTKVAAASVVLKSALVVSGRSDSRVGSDSGEESSKVSRVGKVTVETVPFPNNIPQVLGIFRAQNGKAYASMDDKPNRYALKVGSSALNNAIRAFGESEGYTVTSFGIKEINQSLQAKVEMDNATGNVWYRVAEIPNGIEVDLGDLDQLRVRVLPGTVEIVEEGSQTLFYRTPTMKPMVMPAEVGNLQLLKKYINLDAASFKLFLGWLSYTLAHPKVETSKYVILVIGGGQGSGKSGMCKIAMNLIDPRVIGVQAFPKNSTDLGIATQNAHVNCFDNVRSISHAMSDSLCIASTGGYQAARQLYSDEDQHIIQLHGAIVINGIFGFIDQSDAAQRCLYLHANALKPEQRKAEAEMAAELSADMPAILRGLFDLIAAVFLQLPKVTLTNPERMIEFSRWLGAMELVDGAPSGVYQAEYSYALNEGQRDALLDNCLAAAIMDFAEAVQSSNGGVWSGTPAELLRLLDLASTPGTTRSREWPSNAIALSKRLMPLQAGLLTQGVSVELTRGKHRTITIARVGGSTDA